MKRGISEILKVVTKEGQLLNISVVQKESDLGITYNKRLFVLVENQIFAYLSHFKDDDDPNNIDLSKCKVSVPVKNILKEERNKEILSITFFMIENRKKVNKKWVLKFSTQNLAMLWQRLFIAEKDKSTQRKSMSKNRASDSGSPFKSELINQNSQIKPNLLPSKISSQAFDNSKIKQQLKRQFSIEKKINNVPKQQKMYHNELYESERNKSKDSNMILNDSGIKKDPIRKLTFEQQQLAAEKILHEQMKKQQIQKLNRQRQQLQKKSLELQEKERRLKNEQLKLEQSKKMANQEKERQFRNELSRKQSQNQQAAKQKQKQKQKQMSYLKSDLSFKPKTKEVKNYDDIVNKVIYGSPSQSLKNSKIKSPKNQQQLEETHDYLFQLQKLKLSNNKMHEKRSPESSPQVQKVSEVTYQLGWTFKYFIQQANGNQYDVICEFAEFCSKMLKQLISQFHLPDRKKKYLPKYRRQEYYLYEKDDIQFKIAFVGLKDANNQNNKKTKDQICDQKSIKKLQIEFKNYQTVYRAIKQSKAKVLRVPLTCICQFQGFVALFKATSKFDGSANVSSQPKITADLEKISTKMKINTSSFKSKDTTLVMKVHNEFYRQIAAQTGRMYMKFEYFLIEEIKELMPSDLLFQRQTGQVVQPGNEKLYVLREQLIGKYKQSNDLISENISASLNKYERVKGSRVSGGQHENHALEKLSQNILVPLNSLIKQLDCLEMYFIHPLQISNKLHEMGINIRYLGTVYEHCTLNFSKMCVLTQIAARTCKALFRKTIQDITIEQQDGIVNLHNNENICFKVIDFFNCVLGNTVQTKAVWELLSGHSQDYFNVSLNLEEIQRGYFLSSVIYHCGLDVVWTRINPLQVFEVNQFFNEENFVGVKVRVKTFEPILTQSQIALFRQIENEESTAFKTLESQYKIQSGILPSTFYHQNYFHPLRKYISNFISPEMANTKGYANYSLYNQTCNPTKIEFALKFMELKWYLKKQKKEKYVARFSSLSQEITSFYGDFHPLLSELYDSMSQYHRNNGQFQDAIIFSKSSFLNMLKICGTNHQKVGQCYYELAVCCIKAGKKDEAIISLQKAKNIFEINEKQDDVAYSYVCLKLGLLFLSEGKSNEAESIVKFALSTFNKFLYENVQKCEEFLYEEQRVECYQILSRCYQLSEDKQGQINLSIECQKQMRYINVPSNLEKILKVILCPILCSLSSSNAEVFLNIILLIPTEMNVNSYLKAHSRILQRIQEGTLIENINSYLENIQSIDKFIKESHSLDDWRGFNEVHQRETVNDFLSLCEELIYFVGEGYVTGTIRDSL